MSTNEDFTQRRQLKTGHNEDPLLLVTEKEYLECDQVVAETYHKCISIIKRREACFMAFWLQVDGTVGISPNAQSALQALHVEWTKKERCITDCFDMKTFERIVTISICSNVTELIEAMWDDYIRDGLFLRGSLLQLNRLIAS